MMIQPFQEAASYICIHVFGLVAIVLFIFGYIYSAISIFIAGGIIAYLLSFIWPVKILTKNVVK